MLLESHIVLEHLEGYLHENTEVRGWHCWLVNRKTAVH